ncbi:MAG TPA: recombinase RecA [Candidatus Eremiobacteraeota bacterium]|nr:MAG: recombinase A [bacterium ADurb.Bin363]HPZ10552.1 recombinase RecA [Candidatus Eremiobacteraeota bacterium]
MDEEKQKALDATLLQIQKRFGKGAIMQLGKAEALNIESISTGSIALDRALGIGGVPRGRIIEIFGPEGSGKTTLALHIISSAQKENGMVAFIDVEHALDPEYCKKLGVNVDDLYISQPNTGEEALEIVELLVRSNAIDVIVVDSIAALVPKAEIEGEMGDAHMGLQARLMSQALRKLTGAISKSKTVAIFINQIRMKIGVMFGNPETTPGGRAMKFYSSIRLEVRKIDAIKKGNEIIGANTKIKVVKNKVAPPFKELTIDIMFGEGISIQGELIDLGADYGIIEKSGSWYTYKGNKLGQGRENAKIFLTENPSIFKDIEKEIRSKFNLPVPTKKDEVAE